MAVLTMDTATHVLAVGVGRETTLLGSAGLLIPRGHSVLLQPTIDTLLKSAGVAATDLSLIVTGIGPGSYTGVRMAVSTAKAMAVTLKVPILPISTLLTIAEAAVPAKVKTPVLVLPLLYARRQRAFGAIYVKQDDTWKTVVEDDVRPVSDWMDLARAKTGELGLGLGALVMVHDFTERTGLLPLIQEQVDVREIPLDALAPGLGAAMFHLAISQQNDALTGDAVHDLAPHYGMPVEAEAKLKEKGEGQPLGTTRLE